MLPVEIQELGAVMSHHVGKSISDFNIVLCFFYEQDISMKLIINDQAREKTFSVHNAHINEKNWYLMCCSSDWSCFGLIFFYLTLPKIIVT